MKIILIIQYFSSSMLIVDFWPKLLTNFDPPLKKCYNQTDARLHSILSAFRLLPCCVRINIKQVPVYLHIMHARCSQIVLPRYIHTSQFLSLSVPTYIHTIIQLNTQGVFVAQIDLLDKDLLTLSPRPNVLEVTLLLVLGKICRCWQYFANYYGY